jgi:hypothetical protein
MQERRQHPVQKRKKSWICRGFVIIQRIFKPKCPWQTRSDNKQGIWSLKGHQDRAEHEAISCLWITKTASPDGQKGFMKKPSEFLSPVQDKS